MKQSIFLFAFLILAFAAFAQEDIWDYRCFLQVNIEEGKENFDLFRTLDHKGYSVMTESEGHTQYLTLNKKNEMFFIASMISCQNCKEICSSFYVWHGASLDELPNCAPKLSKGEAAYVYR